MFRPTSQFFTDLGYYGGDGTASISDITKEDCTILWRVEDSLLDISAARHEISLRYGARESFYTLLQGKTYAQVRKEMPDLDDLVIKMAELQAPVFFPAFRELQRLAHLEYPVKLVIELGHLAFHPAVKLLGLAVIKLSDLKFNSKSTMISPFEGDFPDFLIRRAFNRTANTSPEYVLSLN